MYITRQVPYRILYQSTTFTYPTLSWMTRSSSNSSRAGRRGQTLGRGRGRGGRAMGRPRRAPPKTPVYIAPDINIDPIIIISGPATTTQELPLFRRAPAPPIMTPPPPPPSTNIELILSNLDKSLDAPDMVTPKVSNTVVLATLYFRTRLMLTHSPPPQQTSQADTQNEIPASAPCG